jgi:DNA-directed RNA polymerase specialized sigma24 family protein
MISEEQFEQLAQKFDTVIKLVAGSLLKEAKNKTEKVKILYDLGISTKEIAQLVGTSEASVEVLKTRLKKRTTKPKGGKKSGENQP